MNTRDQLIADWQKRLAAAEEPAMVDSSRAAWLARLRVRLYRFLLSLYGGGDWNAPEAVAERPREQSDSVVIDAGALPLSGKPAKDESTIRATLESIAKARENAAVQGPLAAGIDRDAWVVVASTRWLIDPQRCAEILQAKNIIPRLVSRSNDCVVEVRAYQEITAVELIRSQLHRLRIQPPPRRPSPFSPEEAQSDARTLRLLGVLLSSFVIAGCIVACLNIGLMIYCSTLEVREGASVRRIELPFTEQELAVFTCIGFCLLFAEILCLQWLWNRRSEKPRNKSA